MSRSSDIVLQLQHKRAERKKPKVNAKLKKFGIDNSQISDLAAAQENKPPPITLQKTGGRNSLALTFSVVLHVSIALLLGVLYIKNQIVSATEREIAAIFMAKEPPLTPRVINKPPPRPKFEIDRQEVQAPIQRNIPTNANIPRKIGDITLPTTPGADLSEVDTSYNVPRIGGIGEGLKTPIQTPSTTIIPKLDRPSQNPSPTPDLNGLSATTDGPGLTEFDIDTSDKGVTPPKWIKKVEPTYPNNAKKAEKEGTVILLATIGTNGLAKDIKAETSLGFGLEDAAIAALKKSKLIPAKKDGKAVEKTVRVPFEFSLKDN